MFNLYESAAANQIIDRHRINSLLGQTKRVLVNSGRIAGVGSTAARSRSVSDERVRAYRYQTVTRRTVNDLATSCDEKRCVPLLATGSFDVLVITIGVTSTKYVSVRVQRAPIRFLRSANYTLRRESYLKETVVSVFDKQPIKRTGTIFESR